MATAERGTGHSPANVTRFLKGIDFPAKKEELVKQAQQNKAEREVIDEIQKMQEGKYDSMADVMKAYGKEPHAKKPVTEQKQSPQSRHGKTSQHK